MRVRINPGTLHGIINAPPSKSYAHRMLICAALAEGVSELQGIAPSEDMQATMDCIRALKASCEYREDTAVIRGIRTKGMQGSEREVPGSVPEFSCRESGSTLRFFIPIALAVCGGGVFTGTKRLMERGIGIYKDLFRNKGITADPWEHPESGSPGILVRGTLPAGDYTIRGDVSSQFVTGLLLGLSLLDEDSTLTVLPPVESRAYIDITIDVMRQSGITVREVSENCFRIPGGQSFCAQQRRTEGDWSNAAFLYAFQAIGQDIQIRGLNPDSIQGDKACREYLRILQEQRSVSIDLSDTPDLGPVLFAAAAALGGGSFTGTRRLRIKESDRAEAMKEELEKFGIRCRVLENEVVVEKGVLHQPLVPLSGHNDHRIVMALCIPALLTGASIEDAQAVSKSWPEFFAVMREAGMDLQFFS